MTKTFSKNEQSIVSKFKLNEKVLYEGEENRLLIAAKPSPSLGECKTDIYILIENDIGTQKEIKISFKQSNADFLENKISLDRAKQILGNEAQKLIQTSTNNIRDKFEEDYLITFDKVAKTEAKTLKIGWRFELLNKISGQKSGELKLNESQLIDIYAGTNMDDDKKNSLVNGIRIDKSGIASHMLIADEIENLTANTIMREIVPIEEFVKNKKVYFACKAVNFRVEKDKWDGNRPLAVFVDWENNETITAKIRFDKPLEITANQIGLKIREILSELKIESKNFETLENHLSNDIIFYKN